MHWVHQLVQFPAQNFHLLVGQNANTLQVAIFAEKFELLIAQSVLLPIRGAVAAGKKLPRRWRRDLLASME
jgi:hypothetical protein